MTLSGVDKDLQKYNRYNYKVPTKHISRNFDFSDLRSSGQFSGLSIISLWENVKMLPVSHKLTETTLFQDHDHSPVVVNWQVNWWSGVTGRSSEVTWGHDPFFANNSRQDGDRDAQMVLNDLASQATSEDMHIDLLESWPDLYLTWPEVRFWSRPF